MSRAAWVGLLLIGAACGLVAYIATRGLPEETRAAAAAITREYTEAQATVAARVGEIEALVASDSAYFASQPEVAEGNRRVAAAQAELVASQGRFSGLATTVLEADRYLDQYRLDAAIVAARTETAEALKAAEAAVGAVKVLQTYKTDHQSYVDRALAAAGQVASVAEPDTLRALLAVHGADCAEARPKIESRIQALGTEAARIGGDYTRFEALVASPPIDYAAAGRLAVAIEGAVRALQSSRSALVADLESLRQSRDRVLVDMRQEGNTYEHKYRDVVNGVAAETGWTSVPYQTYLAHTDHLGLTIESKPECTPTSEKLTHAAPPGYHYVGNPRYGQWVQRDGGSFWEFYGKYRLLSDVFFGAGLGRNVNRTAYTSYRTAATAGKPWFGSNNEFGTKGSETQKRYATSTYVKRSTAAASGGGSSSGSGGYQSSSYRSTGSSTTGKSGGYSSSSYRSGSSGSSSSRSGSYRSSSYRSSSRSGGGK